MPRHNRTPLTPDQRALAAQYYAHAFWVVRHKVPRDVVDALGVAECDSVALHALCLAARAYRPDYRTADGKPVTFQTYVTNCIVRRLGDALLAARLIHVPSCARYNAATREAARQALALSVATGTGANAASTLDELTADPHDPDDVDAADALAPLLAALTDRQRDVIERTSGLRGGTETLAEVARAHGVTRSAVQQWRAKALFVMAREAYRLGLLGRGVEEPKPKPKKRGRKAGDG